MLKKLKNQYLWIREMMKINIKTIFEYKAALIIQAVGMFINDFGFIMVWFMFFSVFKDVNGWGFKEMIAINGFVSISVSLVFSFTYGIRKISKYVTYGQFDRFLVLPKSPLISAMFTEIHPSAIGDLFFGLASLIFYIVLNNFNLLQISMFPVLIFCSTCIMAGFLIIAESVVFWVPNSEDLSETFFEFLIGPSLRPTSSYTGAFKYFFTIVVPAILIAGFPIDVILKIDYFGIVLMVIAAIVWLYMARKIFYIGLRRYESGSLVGAR